MSLCYKYQILVSIIYLSDFRQLNEFELVLNENNFVDH